MKTNLTRKVMLLFMLLAHIAYAQEKSVSGTIKDESGPLPGVTVLVKGTSIGTETDFNGEFTLKVKPENVLVFSYLGYKTIEKTVGSTSVFNLTMVQDDNILDEVVVVGFGKQSKRNLTDNVAKISGKDLQEISTPSLQNTLSGKAAGVQVTQVNGKVDGGVKIFIRGVSTISSSKEPLYVIDGVPIINANESGNGAPTNPLISLNPNDIESIDILKDASSAAIYGSRGTNGVILITTKKGKEGRAQVSVNFSQGVSTPTNKREWLNASEYAELLTEAIRNRVPAWSQAQADSWVNNRLTRYSGGKDWKTVDTDWQEQAFQNGFTKQADVTVSGGSAKTSYFISGGYNDTKGIVRGNDLERINFRSNISNKASDKLLVGINASLSDTKINRIANDNAFVTPLQAIAQTPTSPIYKSDGTLNDRTLYANFLLEDKYAGYVTKLSTVLGNVFAEYEIIPALKFRSEVGYNLFSQTEDRFRGSKAPFQATGGEATFTSVRRQVVNLNNYFTFDKRFNDSHDLNVVVGMSFEKGKRRNQFVTRVGLASDDLNTPSSGAKITSAGGGRTEYAFLSYFGRATYTIDNKYIVKGSLRYDGSSRFGKDHRYGLFPAASVGWIASEEDFLSDSKTLSLLKVRASWGVTGNAGIGNFPSLGLFSPAGYNEKSGLAPTQLANPALKWEKTSQIDFGVEYGFLDNRITGEIDFYQKRTNDLLLNKPVPATNGFSSITENIGAMKNSGIEFIVNTKNIVKDNFSWDTSLNVAYNKNEVTSLPSGQIISGRNIIKEGESISSFYLVEYAGVDPANGNALFVKNTKRPDGSLDKSTTSNYSEAQRIIVGNPFPKVIAGLTNRFKYNNIDLSFTFQGQFGASLYNNAGRFQSAGFGGGLDNQTKDQLQRWQKPGDITNVPRPIAFRVNGSQHSTRYLQSADFIRLRNITLGYNLPQSVLDKLKLSKVRIYATGLNLITITNYDGYDPESSNDSSATSSVVAGTTFYSAPAAKTVSLGVNIGF